MGLEGPRGAPGPPPPASYRLENCPRRAVTCLRAHTEQYPAAIIIWSQPIPPGSGPGGRTPGANPPPRSAPARSPADWGMERFPHGSVRFSSVQSLSRVQLFSTRWTTAHQASLSITNSQSLLKLTSIESVMPSNYLILCRPLLLPPSIFPIRVFSNESAL